MKSFKQMIKDGEVRRADAMKVRLADIHEEPGFNLRQEGEDLEASIEALAQYIADGGIVPPLEVRPRVEGGVYVVDGHRRRRAYLRVADAIGDASGEVWIPVVAFSGNDADRVARIITSAEGRALSLLEVAEGYRRLVAFGWASEQIAKKVGKTRQHVDQALILAGANSDVHKLVRDGKVSGTTAIDTVRKHGEKAGDVLAGAVDKAAKDGKGKATVGAVKGKSLPRNVVNELANVVQLVSETLSDEVALYMAGYKDDAETLAEVPTVEVRADVLAELIAAAELVRETREKQDTRGRTAAAKRAQVDIETVVA